MIDRCIARVHHPGDRFVRCEQAVAVDAGLTRRCMEHHRTSTGLGLTRAQRIVLIGLLDGQTVEDLYAAGRISGATAARSLWRKKLVRSRNGKWLLTDWGRDVAGGLR